MIIKHNIPSYSITWLANTYDKEKSQGIIENYYIPENDEEYISLCRSLFIQKKTFRIIGHTSNTYIRPNTSIKNVISTRKLTEWSETEDEIICSSGVSVKKLAAVMITNGIEGFAELVDLPGTVGAAIYGNAGVGPCLLSNILISTDILQKDGEIKQYTHDDLNFHTRTSALKEGSLGGAIVSVRLKKRKGNTNEIKQRAKFVHDWRLINQPGPSNNLGTTILKGSKWTLYGLQIRIISKILYHIISIFTNIQKTDLTMSLMRSSRLSPYLAGLNRFMWIDKNAHEQFGEYIRTIKRIYKNPKLEIEVW